MDDNLIAGLKAAEEYRIFRMSGLTIRDKELYYKYIKETEYPANVWASNFAYLWSYTRSDKLAVFKGFAGNMLVTFLLSNKGRLYLPCLPFGKGNAEDVAEVLIECAKFCFKWNKETGFTEMSAVNPVNEIQLDFLKQSRLFADYFIPLQLTGLERHYSISLLTELKGKDFSHLRGKINYFYSHNPDVVIRKYELKDFTDVIELGKLWENTSGQKYERIIDGFYFENIVKHYQELDHTILVADKAGTIIGMTTGGLLPTGQAWGCLTKFINDYRGLSEALVVAMAQLVHKEDPHAEYMNVGSDLGSKGLAFYKERFRPVFSYKRYALLYKNHQE